MLTPEQNILSCLEKNTNSKYNHAMRWRVLFKKSVRKKLLKLPRSILQALAALAADIENGGPARGDWPNYSRLSPNRHHCHLKKGRPTYVAVWEEERDEVLVEVIYVGTHEDALY